MNTLNKISLLMLALAALAMGGCAGVSTIENGQALTVRSAKTAIVYGQVMHGWGWSVETVCKKPAAASDERCSHQADYMATVVNMRASAGGFGAMSTAQVLALKSDNVEAGDILKIELHGAAPAVVLSVASRGNTPACYWKRGFPSGGGVICDGWDYRTDLAD